MKQKATQKRLVVALSFALVLMLAIGGIICLETNPVAHAEDALPEEVTYFSGIRSSTVNTIYLYWRLDGADLGSPSATGIAVDWYSADSSTPTTKYLKLSYTTVGALNKTNQGSTILRANAVYTRSDTSVDPAVEIYNHTILKTNAPAIKIDWFNNQECTSAFAAAAGDSFTLASGTAISSSTTKHVTNQDYTFTFGGTANSWTLSDDTHIPIGFDGARGGNQKDLYVYGSKLFTNYVYSSNTVYNGNNSQGYTVLNDSVVVDYYASATADPVERTVEIQCQWLSTENNGYTSCLRIDLKSNVEINGSIVLKKGTKFDNYIVDRDYTFTQYAASGRWYMTADTVETDPTMTLTTRGGNLKDGTGIYLLTTSKLSFTADERFAKWNPVDVNGSLVYTSYMAGLSPSGDQSSFMIRFHSAQPAGALLTLPKGMYIAGYRLAKTHYFKYVDSTTGWIAVTCDGTNHVYDDEFTCHDRTCACGNVSQATTDHLFAAGSVVCLDRICQNCGDTVVGEGHKFAADSFACQDRQCTVCLQTIAATEDHKISGTECDTICADCGVGAVVHTFPQAPEEGWNVDNEKVTVTTQPDCTTKGAGTVKCEKCDATQEVVVNALGHNVVGDSKYCSRECGYRIPYTADDMAEILALQNLAKYTYGDSHAESDVSVLGQLGAKNQENGFLINTNKIGEKQYAYVDGKADVHNMTLEFALNLTSWSADGRSQYVYMMAHENGSWGIGFQFVLQGGAKNIRVNYKSADGKEVRFVEPVTLTGIELNQVQKFKLGVVQNSDGSYFVFVYHNGNLFLTGTLSNTILTSNASPDTHNGLGGAIAFRFNAGSTDTVGGTICNFEHRIDGTQYACKEYHCAICSTTIAATANHTYGAPQKTGEGNCSVKEQFTSTCSVCSHEQVTEGDYVHNWNKDAPIVVTPAACGDVNRVEKYNCHDCDAVSADTTIAGTGISGAHNYQWKVITPATCVAKGEMNSTCSKCGDVADNQEIPVNTLTGHAWGELVAKVDETCTTNGTIAHYECTLCDAVSIKEGDAHTLVTDLVIPASHKYQLVAKVDATCTQDGTIEHHKCSVCAKLFVLDGESYVEKAAADLVIEAGHKYVDGVCSVCQAKDNLYFFNQAMADLTNANTSEAKFNALKVAIEKFNLLSADQKTENKSALDAQVTAYNTMANSANSTHEAQSNLATKVLGLVAAVSALLTAAFVLRKF